MTRRARRLRTSTFAVLASLASPLGCSRAEDASIPLGSPVVDEQAEARAIVRRLRETFPATLDQGEPHVLTGAATARVELPPFASGAVRVTDPTSGRSVAFALRGAARSARATAEQLAVYRGAVDGADLVHRVGPRGIEDFVAYARRPDVEALTYDVDVTGVAGLRMVSGLLELLDAGGAPRLRVERPYVVGAAGSRHDADLVVRGCRVDADPRPPWGRAVVAPGSTSCELTVSWARRGVSYPALVDPVWSVTDLMAAPRMEFTLTGLASGKLLAVGGTNDAFFRVDREAALTRAELYDPVSNTWAETGSLATLRFGHAAALLDDGTVLVTGGLSTTSDVLATSERYDAATGLWSPAAPLATARAHHTLTRLVDGRVLAAGGGGATAELYEPALDAWSATGGLATPRERHTATRLLDGKVLVIGGGAPPSVLASTETYSPSSRTWSAGPPLPVGRVRHTATLLPSGRVMVVGGGDDAVAASATAWLYDPVAATWTATGSLRDVRGRHSATLLSSGHLLVVGGRGSGTLGTAELWDPTSGAWSFTVVDTYPRDSHEAALLPGGRVLLAGGWNSRIDSRFPRTLAGAELFTPLPVGTPCTVAGECATGHCVDGVCCDGPCSGSCQACSAAVKGGGADGVCENFAVGTDPENECPDDGAATCGRDGQCDGKGTCRTYARGVVCSPSACDGASVTASTCDGAGVCAPAAIVCAPYACAGAACKSTCASEADCAPGYACDTSTGACHGGTTCDGDHTLTAPTGATTDCAPYRCEGSVCKTACASVRDCAEGAICDARGACIPASPDDAEGGCSAAPVDPARGLGVLGALFALALAGRRRRPR